MFHVFFLGAYGLIQLAYLFSLSVVLWLFSQRVDTVTSDGSEGEGTPTPEMLLLYPVLKELESTMRTTLLSIAQADYPRDKLRVVAIPNANDHATIDLLHGLAREFHFLEILEIPSTSDPTWLPVWQAWEDNEKAYWWHQGRRASETQLPPKKTRQLVYALSHLASVAPDSVLTYIDADSVVPADYFRTGANGMRQYDVVQNTNVGGNLLQTLPASMFAMDHMSWDGSLYPHMTAGGKHPFYTLGKGVFVHISDLVAVGGFNPWLTIEDPEVGMRLWTNGRRLGVVRQPLIEEVPLTLGHGITQRKRWAAGFYQSLASPLRLMGMTRGQRMRARLNLVPCLSLFLNPLGAGLAVVALAGFGLKGRGTTPTLLEFLTITNVALASFLYLVNYRAAWRQSAAVLPTRRARLYFMVRVNPLFLMIFWAYWTIPLAMGFFMYLTDGGLTWERTRKVDANHRLVRDVVLHTPEIEPGPKVRRPLAVTSVKPRRTAIRRSAVGRSSAPGSTRTARYAALMSIVSCGLAVVVLLNSALERPEALSIASGSAGASASARGLTASGLVGLARPQQLTDAARPSGSLVLGAKPASSSHGSRGSAGAAFAYRISRQIGGRG